MQDRVVTVDIPPSDAGRGLYGIVRMSRWLVGPATLGVLTALVFVSALGDPGLSAVGSIASPRWNEVPMPALLESSRAVAVLVGGSEFLYVIGGKGPGTSVANGVYFARSNPDGSLGGWTPTSSIYHTSGLQEHSAVAVGGRIYVLGGRGNSWNTFRTVYCAKPDDMGRISDWIPVASMPTGLTLHSVVAVDNVIYVIGGGSSQKNGYVREVWAADMTGDSCSGLQWRSQPEASLPRALAAHSAAAVKLNDGRKFIYVTGGYDGSPYKEVYRAEIGSRGKLTPWVPLGDLSESPAGFFRHVSVISGRYLYVIGGTTTGHDCLDTVYRARIKDNGDLETWSTLDRFPVALFNHAAAVSAPGRIYVLGGNACSTILDRVHYTPLLSFEKSASPTGSVTSGDTINYRLKLTNLGVRDFETLYITDTIKTNVPANLEFHPTGECSQCSDDTITCAVSNLAIGMTKDLSFAVTVSETTPALLQAPNLSSVSLATATPHFTWPKTYSMVRLEMVGAGINGLSTKTLHINNPGTISGDIRMQAAFKIDSGETPGGVTFCSSGVCAQLSEPTRTADFVAVYEHDVPASDAISVTIDPADCEKASALIAYFLRETGARHNLVGNMMCEALREKTYTHVFELPLPANSGEINVKAVVTDNNDPERVVRLAAQAGGVSQEITFTGPSHGNYLDIRELRLGGVPTAASEVTVVVESPPDGESLGLVALAVDTYWPPLRVVNKARVCENTSAGSWCWEDAYINTDVHIHLPMVLRNSQ